MEPIFNIETIDPVRKVLERLYRNGHRVRIWYGRTVSNLHLSQPLDTVGHSWAEEFEVVGTIGRSTGRVKVPLLINNARSLGGGAIMVNSIVRIDDIRFRKTLWQHPAFVSGFEGSRPTPMQGAEPGGLTHEVRNDLGELAARFKSAEAAQRYIDFQNGERYSK